MESVGVGVKGQQRLTMVAELGGAERRIGSGASWVDLGTSRFVMRTTIVVGVLIGGFSSLRSETYTRLYVYKKQTRIVYRQAVVDARYTNIEQRLQACNKKAHTYTKIKIKSKFPIQ